MRCVCMLYGYDERIYRRHNIISLYSLCLWLFTVVCLCICKPVYIFYDLPDEIRVTFIPIFSSCLCIPNGLMSLLNVKHKYRKVCYKLFYDYLCLTSLIYLCIYRLWLFFFSSDYAVGNGNTSLHFII